MDRQALWTHLVEKHQNRAPRSRAHSQEASRFQIRGGSHNLRLFEPFPFFDEQCSGSKVVDLDGNVYVDFWQGHYTNGAPAPRPLDRPDWHGIGAGRRSAGSHSRLTVDSARRSGRAIERIEQPAITPRDISSHSDNVSASRDRRRGRGRMPPVCFRIPSTEEWWRSKSRAIDVRDSPLCQRSHIKVFCSSV